MVIVGLVNVPNIRQGKQEGYTCIEKAHSSWSQFNMIFYEIIWQLPLYLKRINQKEAKRQNGITKFI